MNNTMVTTVILVSALIPAGFAQAVPEDSKAGQGLYEQQCLRCHGLKLDGNGPDGHDFFVRPANLRSQISRSKTDLELLVAISNCVLFSPMHSFRGKLTDEQMLDVLSYIRFMSPPDITS